MDAALHGNLQDFGIADVLQLIGQQRKTGFLELESDGRALRIGFQDGAVLMASPAGELEFSALGESLVRSGLLPAAEFERALDQSRSSARPLPDLWIERGVVTQADLKAAFDLLTWETLFEVMKWPRGEFHFIRGSVQNALGIGSPLAVERVLMEGLRRLDEWGTFDVDVRSPNRVFRRTEDSAPVEAIAHPEGEAEVEAQIDVLGWVDGQRSVSEIVDRTRRGSFEVTQILSELHRSGRIQRVERQPPRPPSRARPLVLRAVQLGAAVLMPLVSLALVVGLSMVQGSPPGAFEEQAGIHRPWVEARMRFERLRKEHVREAEDYRNGEATRQGSAELPISR